ncbi:MAG: DUF503 domain-containing protein [Candidatus Omnitrophica bacterium]|nr:DUF503 domain-containing protein [Candidatus Omnitrophota bacterium]
MSETTVHLGVLTVDLFIPASGSLKSKRSVLKSLKDKIRSRFNVSVAELSGMDKWQTSVFGICMIGSDKSYVNSCLDSVLSLMEQVHGVELVNHQIEFL